MSRLSRMCHITPLPPSVSREQAVAHLHNHRQMIQLNPLVLHHEQTTAHDNAPRDEVESMTWYQITDEIQYMPGIKGAVSYKAGFYDLPNGLQTHTFAAGGVEIRGKWTIGGNAPGERREEVEIGSKKPRDGLYIQEEVDLRCNVLLTNFVKKNLKKSHATLVDSVIEKATRADLNFVRPEHTRSASDQSTSDNPPGNALSSTSSTPTSYNQTGYSKCTCPMAAFGVHMTLCSEFAQSSQSKSMPGTPERQQPPPRNGALELDGNPVKAHAVNSYGNAQTTQLG